MAYLSKRREKLIQVAQQMQAEKLKFQASKKGAIAVLMIFAAIGLIAGTLAGFEIGKSIGH